MFVCQSDTEVLFPDRVIPQLRELRGRDWARLVDDMIQNPPESVERVAFGLLMVRLNGCVTCHADSYRAVRGCTTCAKNTVLRYKGRDADLLQAYELARQDMERYLAEGIPAGV